MGLFQWLVLRPNLTHAVDWVLHGGAGSALAFELGLLVLQFLGASPLAALMGYLLFGLIIAMLQWPMLRREVPRVAAWVIASVLGWAAGAYLSQVVVTGPAQGGAVSPLWTTVLIAAITGSAARAITGLALVWIVRQPDRRAQARARQLMPAIR